METSQLGNLVYKAIIGICENLEHQETTIRNGHHLAQRLVKSIAEEYQLSQIENKLNSTYDKELHRDLFDKLKMCPHDINSIIRVVNNLNKKYFVQDLKLEKFLQFRKRGEPIQRLNKFCYKKEKTDDRIPTLEETHDHMKIFCDGHKSISVIKIVEEVYSFITKQ